MKKLFLFALLAFCSLMTQAAEQTGVMYLTSPANYQVLSISENGLWACGSYSPDGETGYGFRWNLTTGKIETFEAGTSAYTVSNDGVVAGSYPTNEVTGSEMEVPGIWDGKWTMLELPNRVGAWATGITPDGHYVTGTDNNYVSYIWKDGKIQHTAKVTGIVPEANGTFLSYAISPDGTKIGGWAYYSDDNRNPGYWDSADGQFHELNPGMQGSPWQSVRKFSPDGKQLLYWGGYTVDPQNKDKGYGIKAIYDMEQKTSEYIYPIWSDPFNFDFFDIGGKGSVVGFIQDDEGYEYGFIYQNGKTSYIEDYLKEKGANFTGMNMATDYNDRVMLFRAMSISADEKTFGLVYYDQSYDYHSIIVILDQDMTMTPPVCLEASQVPGIMVSKLSWSAPLGDKSTLQGYNIYRDGVKVNSEMITSTNYYDKNLAQGTYQYTVVAVYTEGDSEQSEPCTVTIAEQQPQAPRDLMARQKGYQNLLALWSEPSTNYIVNNYYGDGSNTMNGFGGGTISFESAVRYDEEQVGLYEGFRLMGVSFYPMSEQASWVVNIYRHLDGKLTLLKSQTITQQLTYGERNIVKLTQPLTLQAGQDLLVGIQSNVYNDGEGSYNVQGVFDGSLKVGYTDLIRQVGEADFYSINAMSQGESYDMTWGTSALLAPKESGNDLDNIDHYTVYIDGVKRADTKELCYEDGTLAAGSHTIGVQANYADGRTSESVTSTTTLTKNEQVLQITPALTIEGDRLTASWSAPTDNDPTEMSYCSGAKASKHPSATESVTELTARVDFTPAELRSYEGYLINSLSFLPLSNSSYELQVYEDDTPLLAAPVDEFVIGQWNTITLPEPITIVKGKTYRYCIVCYDCPVGEPPLAIDNRSRRNDYSCLIQSGGEEGWYLISEETAYDGNWMVRMNLVASGAAALPVSGYDVYVDGTKQTTTQTTEYAQQFTVDTTKHTLRVDANYSTLGKTVQGNPLDFYMVIPTAISEIHQPATTGDAPIFNLNGQKVNSTYKGLIISNGKTMLQK